MGWEVLGDLRVIERGHELQFRGQRSRDVLAVLILARNQPLSIERLVDELWPDDPPSSARNSVQRFVSDVRAGLGPQRHRLRTLPSGYALDLSGCDLDLVFVEQQLREGLARADAAGVEHLRAAIEALARPLCPASNAIPLVAAEQTRLSALRLHAMERAASLRNVAGAPALEELGAWCREFPFNERLAASQVNALASAGRQREALALVHELRERLRDEAGLSPSAELNQIELEILQNDQFDRFAAHSPHRPIESEPRIVSDLLIGRDEELDEIERLLEDHRLVTLSGLGGAGKTTLALHAVERLRSSGRHTTFARLEDAKDLEDVLETIAASIGLAPSGADRPHATLAVEIARYLARSNSVVVLDNAEHVLSVIAGLLRDWLAVPGPARVIVTSRHRLGVPAEHVVGVDPLALQRNDDSAEAAPAVQLFVARGSALPGIDRAALVDDPHVERICGFVDGLPLALELAAAQLRVFTTAELAARLEQSSKPLRSSEGGHSRHSSLDVVLASSWELLTRAEAQLLAELSLHSSFSVDTVEFLAGEDGPTTLHALVDKSLVTLANDRLANDRAQRRFGLLETVRKYASAQLVHHGEHEARDRHAGWILQQIDERSDLEASVDAGVTARLFGQRVDVLRAIEWLTESKKVEQLFALLIGASGSFAHHGSPLAAVRFYDDAIRAAEDLFGAERLAVDDLGALMTASVDVLHAAGDLERMVEVAFQAISIAGDGAYDWLPGLLANTAVLIETAACDGSCETLLVRAEELIARGESSALSTAHIAMWRGLFELINRRYESALNSFDEALSIEARPGRILLLSECSRVICCFLLGRNDQALRYAETLQSRPATDAWHYLVSIVTAIGLGGVDARSGARHLESALGSTVDPDFVGHADDVRIATGVLAWHSGDHELCRRLLDGVMARTPSLLALLVEYVDAEPNQTMSERVWQRRWREVVEAYFSVETTPPDSWVTTPPRELTIEAALGLVGLGATR